MYFPECLAMYAGISAIYFLKPLKSFTDKSSTKYAFIPYLANLRPIRGPDGRSRIRPYAAKARRPPSTQSWRHEQVTFVGTVKNRCSWISSAGKANSDGHWKLRPVDPGCPAQVSPS